VYVNSGYFNFDKVEIQLIVKKLVKPFGKSWKIRMATLGEKNHGQ
jgi:hypothetical protein